METRHVRLTYEEAIEAKKQLLSSELNLLHALKKLKAYRTLRKKELATKNKLKIQITHLRTKLALIQSSFPEQENRLAISKVKKQIEKEHKKDIQEELEDIRAKLAKLE